MQYKRGLLIWGYVLLFLGVVGFDQTAKFHAEKSYLQSSSSTEIANYTSSRHTVLTLGSPPVRYEEGDKQPDVVSKNWLRFDVAYLRNEGAVWGVFSSMPSVFRLGLFYSVTVIAVAGVLMLFRKSAPENKIYRTALVLVLAGAIGNFIDRLLLQYVIDFLHFSWRFLGWEYSFPVFNVADVAIDVGIGLMLLDVVLQEGAAKRAQPQLANLSEQS